MLLTKLIKLRNVEFQWLKMGRRLDTDFEWCIFMTSLRANLQTNTFEIDCACWQSVVLGNLEFWGNYLVEKCGILAVENGKCAAVFTPTFNGAYLWRHCGQIYKQTHSKLIVLVNKVWYETISSFWANHLHEMCWISAVKNGKCVVVFTPTLPCGQFYDVISDKFTNKRIWNWLCWLTKSKTTQDSILKAFLCQQVSNLNGWKWELCRHFHTDVQFSCLVSWRHCKQIYQRIHWKMTVSTEETFHYVATDFERIPRSRSVKF